MKNVAFVLFVILVALSQIIEISAWPWCHKGNYDLTSTSGSKSKKKSKGGGSGGPGSREVAEMPEDDTHVQGSTSPATTRVEYKGMAV